MHNLPSEALQNGLARRRGKAGQFILGLVGELLRPSASMIQSPGRFEVRRRAVRVCDCRAESADGEAMWLAPPALPKQANERQRQLRCSRSVPSDLPAERLFTDQVEQVVGDLECQPQISPIAGQLFNGVLGHAAIKSPEPAAAGRQLGRLAVDDGEIVLFRKIEIASLTDLVQFAGAEPIGGIADDLARRAWPRVLVKWKECVNR